jgi:hypothetical protein
VLVAEYVVGGVGLRGGGLVHGCLL